MFLRHLYNEHLAQASYLVGCAATGEALVIDPTRDLDQYVALAEREGFRITAVTETHIHADFVSGARELAARTGAQLYLSGEGTPEWEYAFAQEAGAVLLHDGATFMVGNLRLEVLHTPGHTPEHLSFLLTDTAGADQPMGLFTGDFVFVGDVGRPDLLERAAGHVGTMEDGARRLFASLRRFRDLPDYLQVWPGHGAGSACGKALGAVPQSTAGYEKRFNWALQIADEDTFVSSVLEGQPNPPRYFAQMKRINREGPPALSSGRAPLQLHVLELEAQPGTGVVIVDTRPADIFAGGHVPGTINIPLDASFVTWAGWLLPYDRPLLLIADDHTVTEAVRRLQLIGLDTVDGYWTPTALAAWGAQGHEPATVQRVDAATLEGLLGREDVLALDVREPSEVLRGALAGSRNLPLGYLTQRLAEVPRDRLLAVYCQSGTRSSIAASLLKAAGYTRLVDLIGGFEGWQQHQRVVPIHTSAR